MAKSNLPYFIVFVLSTIASAISIFILDSGACWFFNFCVVLWSGFHAFDFRKGKLTDVVINTIDEGRTFRVENETVRVQSKSGRTHTIRTSEVFIRRIKRRIKRKELEDILKDEG
jgi:hypothetical protein